MSGNPKQGPDDLNAVIKFGGGLHSKASPDEINPREAADGFNFLIDLENKNLRNRPPFDLIGRTPNGLQIRGGASLLKSDGTVSTLFQSGGVVYKWDGLTTFSSVGTCNAGSQLRGHWRSHNWTLDDKVIITDLALLDTVKEWNGTTYKSTVFTNEVGSGFGAFSARYVNVDNERAVFSNVKDAGSPTPQMIVGSTRSQFEAITVNNRPSASLSDSDPFFLLSPDLKPINGMVTSFGTTMISTEKGQIFNLTGSSAKDFSFNPFYPGSYASGAESMTDIGNDIIYGRQGRLESVRDTNTFGNARAADISSGIADIIENYRGWTTAFNSRLRHVYLFPTGVSECWVMDTAIRDSGQISPWMRWKTLNSMGFIPTFVMSMLDPVDTLEYVFMGDALGNIYRMEGTGTSGDAGNANIELQYLTKLYAGKLDEQSYDLDGYIKYSKDQPATVTLTFQYQGKEIFNKSVVVNLPSVSSSSYYNDNVWYNGNFFYGSIAGKLSRQAFYPPGSANDFQLLVQVTGTTDIEINEIGIRLRAATN